MLKLINNYSSNIKWNLLAGAGVTAALFAAIPLTTLNSSVPPISDTPSHKNNFFTPPIEVPDFEKPEKEEVIQEDDPELTKTFADIPLIFIGCPITDYGTGNYTNGITINVSSMETEAPIYEIVDLSEPPRAITTVDPMYPRQMKNSGIQGYALVEFIITEDGRVIRPKVYKSNNKAFGDEAMRAVRKWRFSPGRVDGEAVMVRARQQINFTL